MATLRQETETYIAGQVFPNSDHEVTAQNVRNSFSKDLDYTDAKVKEVADNLTATNTQLATIGSKVGTKLDNVSTETTTEETQELVFAKDNGTLIGKINDNGLDFVSVKKNGVDVLTQHQDISNLATKTEVSAKANTSYVITELAKKQKTLTAGDNITIAEDGTISAQGGVGDLPISSSTISEDTEEQVWKNDAQTETYASVGSYGIKAKAFLSLDNKDISANKTTISNIMLSSAKEAAPKKILTWIDDDTTSTTQINLVKGICDDLGIKCTFACVTNRLSNANILNALKQCQAEGFHITTHSHTHDRWYKATDAGSVFTAQEAEEDLITSLNLLQTNGFVDCNHFVYPGGAYADFRKTLCKKYCESGVLVNGVNWEGYGGGRYMLCRQFFTTEKATDYYTNKLAQLSNNNVWVIFGSHSYSSTEFSEDTTRAVLQYALSNGWQIVTLSEGYKLRKALFNIQETFNL